MLWALIMAGGSGVRLWPLSNRTLPKPLLKLIPGRDTLLSETLKRLTPLISPSRVFVLGNKEHLAALKKSARHVPQNQMIGEPAARNTAATVGLGASLILKRDPQALVLILPADHWISDKTAFQKAIKTAARYSDQHEQFSILGVKPKFPSSSYGYILMGKKRSSSVYNLKAFIEKPSAARAQKFVQSGKYLWHAGIFLASGANILASIARYAPKLASGLAKVKIKDGKIENPKTFHALANVSFDYAVLEKIRNATLIECHFDWCDVGTWSAMERIWPKDESKNSVFGKCISVDSKGNVIYSNHKLICIQGIHDLVVVDTPDALFVGRKDAGEVMRKVVEKITPHLYPPPQGGRRS